MTRVKGSVTIYTLLSLVLIMGLICTLTEAGRVNCINARLRGLTYMAADSCFAEYASEIFDEYGIMGLWKTDSEFTSDFNEYIRHNMETEDLDLYQDISLWRMTLDASAINEVKHLTDENGDLFLGQVIEYMKYFITSELITEILGNIELFSSGSKLASFIDRINSYKDVFVKVAVSISKIQTAIDKAKSIAYNPRTIIGNMKSSIEKYENTQNNVYVAQFNTELWSLEADKDLLDSYIKTIEDETDNYYIYAQNAKIAIDNLRSELDETKDDYTEETVNAIQKELDDLALKTADTESDHYRIIENGEIASDYYSKLETLEEMFETIDPLETRDKILDYKATVDYYDQLFDDFNMDDLWLDISGGVVEQEDSGFISTVSDIFTKGLLKAVTSGQISENKLTQKELPSAAVSGRASAAGSILSASYKTIVLGEYILDHFGNYTETKEETALEYETEYIIGGKASDKDNLKFVIEKIVMLRAGLNCISFMEDTGKMNEAEVLALAVAGFTGIDALVQMLKTIIISIWCLAEALCDVKALLNGGKIPAVKEPYEWTVSSVGLKNFSKTVLPSATSENGLDYKEYLRLLLLMTGTKDQVFRTMDLIQANACSKYNNDFRMAECICSIDIETEYHADQLFTAFLFVRNILENKQGGYSFSFRQKYEY